MVWWLPFILRNVGYTSKRLNAPKGKGRGFIQRLYCRTSHSTWLKALRYGSHSVTCKLHRTCLYLVSIHQMAHPRTSNCSLLLIYLPWKDERRSRPGCLTYSGRFTHISGHPSAAGRAQDSESSPVTVRDRRSTTVPSVRVVNEKERERRAPKARESRRRWRRGGVWSGEEVYPPAEWWRGLKRGPCPLPRIFFDFFCLAMVHFGVFWALVLMLVGPL